MEISGHTFPETRDEDTIVEAGHPMLPRKTSRETRRRPYQNRHRWAGRAYRGDRENHGQGTRQNSPVTSGEGAPPEVSLLARGAFGGRSEEAQATVYQKHRTLHPSRKAKHRV